MANRIAGITIEIGGDTSKLTTALKDVDKNLKNTQTNLRDVNKLLKLDPGNVDLLKQKQEYLTSAISDTAKKLETEKEALRQMKEGNTTGEVTEQQKALEREIADTTQKLEGLKKEYKDFGGVASQQLKVAGEKLQEMGGKIQDVGKGLTTHVTAPIAAVGAGAVAAWKEVDDALDTVTKKTGATGEALEELQGIAKNIATTIPTSFDKAGEAVGEVNTRFGLTGEKLEKLSTKFVKFAELNDTDVTSSVDSVQKAMEAMNVPVDDAEKFLDALNSTAQRTGIDTNTLTGSIVKNAAAFEDMGLSAGDTVELLGDLEVSGVDVNQAMAGLKKALQSAAKEGKPTSQVLEEVQKSIKGAGTDTEATTAAMAVFGKSAGGNIAKAVRQGKISFEAMGKTLDDYAGNIETTFENTVDPLDQVTLAMNQMKEIGADIVETSAPMISAAMGKLRDIITDLSEKWNSLSDGQKQMAVKIALVVAAAGPLVTVLGGVVSAVGTIVSGVGGLIGLIAGGGGAIAAVGGLAAAAAPFLIGGAVIAGVIAGGIAVYKNWDTIKEKAGDMAEGIKDGFKTVQKKFGELQKNVVKTASDIGANVGAKFNTLKTNATNAFNNMKTNAGNAFNNMKTNAANALENLRSNASAKINAAKTAITTGAAGIASTVGTKFNEAKTKATTALEGLRSSASEKINAAKTTLTNVSQDIANSINTKFNDAKTNAVNAIETLRSSTKQKLDAAKTSLTSTAGTIATNIGEKFNSAKKSATEAIDKLKSSTTEKLSAAKDKLGTTAGEISSSISSGLKSAKTNAESIAKDIKSSLTNKIGGAADTIKEKVGGIASKFSTGLTGAITGAGTSFDKLKEKIKNFSWKFPSIKLPHFTLTTKQKTLLGKTFTYPTGFDVSWYKKAYEDAVMFTRPTVLQTGSGLKGFGDGNGGEVVLSERKLREIAGGGASYTINVYGAAGQNVNELANAVQRRLVALERQKEAAGLA